MFFGFTIKTYKAINDRFAFLQLDYLPAAGRQIPKITYRRAAYSLPHFCSQVLSKSDSLTQKDSSPTFVLNMLCLTGISPMFSIKSKICQTSDGQEKFAPNSIFDFLMKTELF